jgi:hypothetical protein
LQSGWCMVCPVGCSSCDSTPTCKGCDNGFYLMSGRCYLG